VLGRDGVVLGREGKKLEIKLVEPLDELVVEVEELPFEFNLPDCGFDVVCHFAAIGISNSVFFI